MVLMVLFAVSFSSRPVIRLKVSMTFTPKALPIGFNSSVNMYLCFEISSATTAAESGNRQPSSPVQCWGHSLLSSVGARGEGLCIMRSWYLKSLYLELSSFDIRFCSMSTALEKGDLLLSRHSERVNLTLLGRGALDPLFRVQEWSF